jgi:AcrR family transcriptional regulator
MMTGDTTRDRLLRAATQVFADAGYHGAAVRDICNRARANPGAVSYHFGGKRQLYRAVLRQAAEELCAPAADTDEHDRDLRDLGNRIADAMRRLLARVDDDPVSARLILRDLADGGSIAVEALAPALGGALEVLSSETARRDPPLGATALRTLFLELAAPLFLLTAAWPVLSPALGLEPGDRPGLLVQLLDRTLERQDLDLGE